MSDLREKLRRWTFGLIETIPPRDLTVTRMRLIEHRTRAYWRAHGRLPKSLEDLSPLKDRDNATADGWGRAIEFVATAPAAVTLSSRGAGGSDSETIEITFRADESQ
jgi:hypothetical protein